MRLKVLMGTALVATREALFNSRYRLHAHGGPVAVVEFLSSDLTLSGTCSIVSRSKGQGWQYGTKEWPLGNYATVQPGRRLQNSLPREKAIVRQGWTRTRRTLNNAMDSIALLRRPTRAVKRLQANPSEVRLGKGEHTIRR